MNWRAPFYVLPAAHLFNELSCTGNTERCTQVSRFYKFIKTPEIARGNSYILLKCEWQSASECCVWQFDRNMQSVVTDMCFTLDHQEQSCDSFLSLL